MTLPVDCGRMDDREVLAGLKDAADGERGALVRLLCFLAETDRRELHLSEGFPSLFVYCTAELRFSEGAAYRRIHAARAADAFPAIYALLSDGSLSLSAVTLLAPRLTRENFERLLSGAEGKSKRELQFMLASFSPGKERRDFARVIHEPPVKGAGPTERSNSPHEISAPDASCPESTSRPVAATGRQSVEPYASARARIAFDCGKVLLEKLERAREVLRHKYPDGKYEDIFDAALEALLERRDPERRLLSIFVSTHFR